MHLAWDGLTLRADDPWRDAHYPPNGWRCGCRVSVVSEAGLKRMGKSAPDPSPPTVTRPWTNPKTGAVHQVPVGIDPGFDYNMGRAWKEGRAAELPVSAPAWRRDGPREPQPTDRQLEAIRRFVEKPEGSLTIGRLSEAVQRILGAETSDVLLSAETMVKQRLRHPDVGVDDYLLVPLALAEPTAVFDDGERRVVLLRAGARILRLSVKTTADRRECYLNSLFIMSVEHTAQFLRNAGVPLLGDVTGLIR